MNMSLDFLSELLKYTIPGLLVLSAAYLILSSLLENHTKLKTMEMNMRQLELNKESKQETLPIKLQAYERLILFLERASPQNLVSRTLQAFGEDSETLTATEMHYAMVSGLRTEFEHNITQQLYVSGTVWVMIQTVSEEIITVINSIASSLPTDASARDLSKAILEHYMHSNDALPTQKAINQLKDEAIKLF